MPRIKLTDDDVAARATLLGQALRLCTRDDAGVIREVYETKVADDIEALDKVTFCDELFAFMKRIGILQLLDDLDPKKRINALIAWPAMIGVYLIRILLGVPSVPQTEGLILTDPTLMGLFGMAMFVEKGVNQRGVFRAHRLPPIRGAFSGAAMVDAVTKIPVLAVARIFNITIKILANAGYFPKNVYAVVDTTDLEATPKFRVMPSLQAVSKEHEPQRLVLVTPSVASVTRKKRPDHRNNRHAPKVETTVWGWKVWLMFCPTSGLPVAMYVDRINVDDRKWMVELILQGKANLGERLRSVSFDRGFWDGQSLHTIATHVPFFIPGKSNLEITQNARVLATQAYNEARRGKQQENAIIAKRPIPIVSGHGKKRTEKTEDLIIIGFEGLDCPTYATESPGSRVNSKSYRAPKLNVAVVMQDPSYRPSLNNSSDKALVIITNASMRTESDALFAYDRFSDRGIIENSANKEAKQAWHLESPLEKSEQAVILHAHFVFMLMAVLGAMRSEQAFTAEAESRGEESGMSRYRRELEQATRGKLLIRIGDRYGIIEAWEFAVLMGLHLRHRHHISQDPESILRRYNSS